MKKDIDYDDHPPPRKDYDMKNVPPFKPFPAPFQTPDGYKI